MRYPHTVDGRQVELVERYLEMARRVAAMMYPRVRDHVAFDELVALANAGLTEAAARYDPARGVAFPTFAWYRIQGTMLDGLRKSAVMPRRTWARLVAARETARPDTRCALPGASLAGALPGGARGAMARPAPSIELGLVLSLEALRAGGFDAAGEAPGPADGLDLARSAARLHDAVARLPDKQRQIVRMHYWEGKNLLEAGAALGLSKSWTSRLHAQAVTRLRALLDRDPGNSD